MDIYIKGVGTTKYGIHDKPSHLIAYEAIVNALDDSGLKIQNIDAIVCSTLEWFYTGEMQRHFASLLSGVLKTRVPIIKVPAACAGGGAALWTALRLAKNSEYNNILVVGVEKLFGSTRNSESITEEFMMAAESRWEQVEGLCFPGGCALVAQQYLRKYPETTMDDLALISYKNHSNAFLNPKAYFYKRRVSLEEIKRSPIVTSPLRVYDCSISVDGAVAVIISKDRTDIKIIASSLCADFLPPFEREDMTTWEGTVITSKDAYKQASLEPKEIDFAEIHDAFTIVELISYEDLGFAKKGQAYKKIRDGFFGIDGKLPINVSGGLKAKGHPVSATGLGMVYEITKQLRDEAEDRQLTNIKIGLAHNIGGAGGTVVTHIFKKV